MHGHVETAEVRIEVANIQDKIDEELRLISLRDTDAYEASKSKKYAIEVAKCELDGDVEMSDSVSDVLFSQSTYGYAGNSAVAHGSPSSMYSSTWLSGATG